ncbi:MAG: extracellular solute-binding protein, partial [Clostridia bacterium]
EQAYPDIQVETTVVSGVPDFVTVLGTKFASGEAPDVFSFQGGSRTFEYASAGKLLDLSGQEFMNRFYENDLKLVQYQQGVYAMPLNVEMTGLFINTDALKQYGDFEAPTCFPELVTLLDQLVAAGCKAPLVCAGKDIGNVAQVDFQYLATVLWYNQPDYYLDMLQGKRTLNGDESIKDLFAKYATLRNYMSEDALGVDNEEAKKRFIRGDGVVWIAHGSNVAPIRDMVGEEFNFVVVPSVLQDKPEDRVLNAGVCLCMHITAESKNQEAALKLLEFYARPEVNEIYVTLGKQSSPLRDTTTLPDRAWAPCYEFAAANPEKRIGHADLVWIAGIKDVMKEVTQKWFLGENLQSCLDYWQAQHEKLLADNPKFVDEYIAKYYD